MGRGAESFYAEMNSAVLPAMKRVVAAMSEAARATQEIRRIMKQAEEAAAALFRLNGSDHSSYSTTDQSQPSPVDGALPLPAAFVGGAPATGAGSTGTASGGARARSPGAADARAEKVQRVIDEANHLKEMYEDTRRVRRERKAKYEEALRLNKDEREILRLKVEYEAAEHAEGYFKEDMTAKFEEAVHLTIKLYKIDGSVFTGIHYKGEGDYYAFVDQNRVLDIRYDSFSSPGWLASNLLHESTHARQIIRDGGVRDEAKDPQGHAMNEIEAYHRQLAHAQEYGLTQAEIDEIREACQENYKTLEPENKNRVNRGVYDPA